MRIRTVATAVAATAALALGLGTAGTANAATPGAASCSTVRVGDSQNYNAYGMNAGNISQLYNSCTGDTIAHWVWNVAFAQAHSGSYIQISLASVGLNGGVPAFSSLAYPGAAEVDDLAMPHSAANPDSWRAGAELDSSGCAAWSSQHYYAIGAETAGPYAGCNDVGNLNQIPWTQP